MVMNLLLKPAKRRTPPSMRALRRSVRFLRRCAVDAGGEGPICETYYILSFMWDIYVQRPHSFLGIAEEYHDCLMNTNEALLLADAAGVLQNPAFNSKLQDKLFPVFQEFAEKARVLNIDPSNRFRKNRA